MPRISTSGVKSIDAKVTITRPSSGGVAIELHDDASRITFVRLIMSHEEFSKALGSLAFRPAMTCEVRGLSDVGKSLESESFVMNVDASVSLSERYNEREKLAEELQQEAVKQGWAEGGWTISAYTAIHAQKGWGVDRETGLKWFRMTRSRYVAAEEQHD